MSKIMIIDFSFWLVQRFRQPRDDHHHGKCIDCGEKYVHLHICVEVVVPRCPRKYS